MRVTGTLLSLKFLLESGGHWLFSTWISLPIIIIIIIKPEKKQSISQNKYLNFKSLQPVCDIFCVLLLGSQG